MHISTRRVRTILRDARQSLYLNANRAERKRLLAEISACDTPRELMAFAGDRLDMTVCQLPSEIQAALDALATSHPRVVCEIGAATGGNSLLLSRLLPSADLVVCIDVTIRNRAYLRLLKRPAQQIICLEGSSHSRAVVEKLKSALNGRMLDVLFIDGDHSYQGVKGDFLQYRRFVAEGAHILFHDIMPDQGDGWLWSGGVPQLWGEVRDLYPSLEFVDDRSQKGFGIGLIRYSSQVVLPAGFESGGQSVS